MTYQPGQIALRCQPFVYVTEFSIRSRVCDFCLEFKSPSQEENNLKKCSKCKLVYYCNSDCQKNSWEELHQKECKFLRKFKPPYFIQPLESIGEGSSFYYAVYLTRIILKLKKVGGPEIIFDELPNGQRRYFKDLMSHKDSISNDPERLDYFHRIFECLQILWDGTDEILDKSEILEIYGKTYINSLELTTDSNYTIG